MAWEWTPLWFGEYVPEWTINSRQRIQWFRIAPSCVIAIVVMIWFHLSLAFQRSGDMVDGRYESRKFHLFPHIFAQRQLILGISPPCDLSLSLLIFPLSVISLMTSLHGVISPSLSLSWHFCSSLVVYWHFVLGCASIRNMEVSLVNLIWWCVCSSYQHRWMLTCMHHEIVDICCGKAGWLPGEKTCVGIF